MKQQRVQLIARMAPEDHERIVAKAKEEGRSLGELIAVMYRENEILRLQAQQNGVGDGR